MIMNTIVTTAMVPKNRPTHLVRARWTASLDRNSGTWSSLPHPRRRERLARTAREDRRRQRRHEQDTDGEGDESHHRVHAIEQLLFQPQSGRERLEVAAEKLLEHENERVGDDQHE